MTIAPFIQVVDSYIRWYNEKRMKISLGSLSAIEYREKLGISAKTSRSVTPHPQPVNFESASTASVLIGQFTAVYAAQKA